MLDTSGFTGTENHYRHGLVRSVRYTDGVQYVAETAGAYWLLDKIATTGTMEPRLKVHPWQAWKLEVADGKGVLTADDGDGEILYTEEIHITDFPEPGITIWFIDQVMLLPSEY